MATGKTAVELVSIYSCLHMEDKKHIKKKEAERGTLMTFPKSQSLEICQEVLEF